MLRSSVVAIVLLAASLAEAGVDNYVDARPPQPRAAAGSVTWRSRPVDLPVSRFGDRGDHDLYCPHVIGPSPLVVIAPDRGQVREALASVAEELAGAGFVVAVVDPARDRAGDAAVVEAVIGALVAKDPLEPREAGCALAPGVAVWGIGYGAGAVVDVAGAREAAGTPLAAVVAAFAAEAATVIAPPPATPALVIEGDAPVTLPRWQLVVEGASACDVGGDSCRGTPTVARRGSHAMEVSRDARRAIVGAIIPWLRAQVEADPVEVQGLDRWTSRVPFDKHRYEPAESRERLTLFSAPLVLGYTTEGDGGFVWGVRPELVSSWTTERGFADNHSWIGNGVGGYAELLRANGTTIAGAGLTYVHCTQPFALAPSVGIYRRWTEPEDQVGIAASVYTGIRSFELEHFDLPFGVRAEVRYGLGSSTDRSVMVSLDLDVGVGIALIAGLLSSIERMKR